MSLRAINGKMKQYLSLNGLTIGRKSVGLAAINGASEPSGSTEFELAVFLFECRYSKTHICSIPSKSLTNSIVGGF